MAKIDARRAAKHVLDLVNSHCQVKKKNKKGIQEKCGGRKTK